MGHAQGVLFVAGLRHAIWVAGLALLGAAALAAALFSVPAPARTGDHRQAGD
jgi:hypothetical protein